MKNTLVLAVFFISIFYLSASGSLLTIYAGDDFYMAEDRIDTASNTSHHYFDFGFGLDDIGGIGLSLHTDLKASNAFLDGVTGASLRKTFELTTGYLDWRSDNGGFEARLGRQPYTNLFFDAYDFDGLAITIEPNLKTSIDLAGGFLIPTPWAKEEKVLEEVPARYDPLTGAVTQPAQQIPVTEFKNYFFSNPATSGFFLVNGSVSAIPFTTLTTGLSLLPAPIVRPILGYDSVTYTDPNGIPQNDSVVLTEHAGDSTRDLQVGMGATVAPVSFIRFSGSGRFSTYNKGLDRYDARLRFFPGTKADISAYIFSEKGRIDSANYFSIMFFDRLNEFGLTANFYSESNVTVQLDYHTTSIVNEGNDHFVSFDAAHRNLFGGGVFGGGYHGTSLRTYGGFSLPFLKFFTLEGSGEFFRIFPVRHQPVAYSSARKDSLWSTVDYSLEQSVVDAKVDSVRAMLAMVEIEKVNLSPRNAVMLSLGLKMAFTPIGLTIFPRVEYIKNRYYNRDVRVLLTTNLLIKKYWSTGAGK